MEQLQTTSAGRQRISDRGLDREPETREEEEEKNKDRQREQGERSQKTEHRRGRKEKQRVRAELIRGNEGGFSLLQQSTLCFSRCCEPRLYSALQLQRKNGVKIGSHTPTNTHCYRV